MTIEFKVDNLGDGVKSADVAALHVAAGDVIQAGQIVVELETDKAVMEVPCPHAGMIGKLLVKKGDTVLPGQAIFEMEPTTASGGSLNGGTRSSPVTAVANAPSKVVTAVRTLPAVTRGSSLPLPAGPATRRLARELGLNLAHIPGTGSGGRITLEDVARALSTTGVGGGRGLIEPPLPDFSLYGPVDRLALTKLQKTAANNLCLAWQNIPHVTVNDQADITETEAARKHIVATAIKGSPKVTMTVIALKALVACLKEFPQFNASFDSAKSEVILKRYYHIGVAVDTPNGLVVPVIRNVDQKNILQLAGELSELAAKARDRKLQVSEMQGGTFTMTNLGGLGCTSFTPIINFPEVAILGMSRSQKQLHLVDGEVTERLMLPLSLSFDHRVINGADAARFTTKLVQMLGDAFRLLIEC
jgi:pyruvate dehydrogenase E2 component (dihydrolipoamide acetyltransferase)